MTEAEWLTSQEPEPLLKWMWLDETLSERKARLFACACCRKAWPHVRDERSRKAVELAELYADGLVGAEAVKLAHHAAMSAEYEAQDAAYAAGQGTDSDASFAAEAAYHASGHRAFIDEAPASIASAVANRYWGD
jgi:hypothetical protein